LKAFFNFIATLVNQQPMPSISLHWTNSHLSHRNVRSIVIVELKLLLFLGEDERLSARFLWVI
jgi:hypothetical protein